MKIILSRKGFDSGYGGKPSIVLEDGTMVPLFIPSKEKNGHKYSEIIARDTSYSKIMQDNGITKIKFKGQLYDLDNSDIRCHLDPDLSKNTLKRPPGWKPIFGQEGIAAKHLKNKCIGSGDLFLFFGWFQKESLKLDYPSGFHALYGYLYIDEVRKDGDFDEWMRYHPHYYMGNKDDNTIFVSSGNFNGFPCAGHFKFDEKLILTKKGQNRTVWGLPSFMKEIGISYHPKWQAKNVKKYGWHGDEFTSAYIGQEFVFDDDKRVEDWAKKIIENHVIK